MFHLSKNTVVNTSMYVQTLSPNLLMDMIIGNYYWGLLEMEFFLSYKQKHRKWSEPCTHVGFSPIVWNVCVILTVGFHTCGTEHGSSRSQATTGDINGSRPRSSLWHTAQTTKIQTYRQQRFIPNSSSSLHFLISSFAPFLLLTSFAALSLHILLKLCVAVAHRSAALEAAVMGWREAAVMGWREAAVMGWREAAVMGWREAAVGWREAAVMGWREAAVMGWREAAVMGWRETQRADAFLMHCVLSFKHNRVLTPVNQWPGLQRPFNGSRCRDGAPDSGGGGEASLSTKCTVMLIISPCNSKGFHKESAGR